MTNDLTQTVEATRVDPKLLEILVCPLTKLAYPIRDGIPIMLPEEARPLTD